MDIDQQAATRLAEVQALIARAAKTADRDPADVKLIAISKTHPADAILPLIHAGQRVFGENRVQEAQAKWPELKAVYADRSEEHTSELQSLMRHSYAVFCLKKKKTTMISAHT